MIDLVLTLMHCSPDRNGERHSNKKSAADVYVNELYIPQICLHSSQNRSLENRT